MLSLPNFIKKDEQSRRQFVKLMASNMLMLNTYNIVQAEDQSSQKNPVRAKSVINIQLGGGVSHLDSFDIKEADKASMAISAPVKTAADGIRIGKYWAPMAKHMNEFCVINSMTNKHGAHGEAKYHMRTGYDPRGTIVHPNLGAWTKFLGSPINPNLPSYMKIGEMKNLGAGFMSSYYNALPIPDPNLGINNIRPINNDFELLKQRRDIKSWLDQNFQKKVTHKNNDDYRVIYDEASKLMTSSDLVAFDLTQEPEKVRQAYGKDQFAQSCLLARRLVQADIRFIEITTSGFDWHYDLEERQKETVPGIVQAIDALMTELKQLGLLDTTLVAITTEFGRTPNYAKTRGGGRQHHPIAYSSLLAGAGIKGGQKYGKTDEIGREVIENPVKVPQYNATIAYAMGLDVDREIHSDTGRPFKVGDKSKPLVNLF